MPDDMLEEEYAIANYDDLSEKTLHAGVQASRRQN